MPITADAVKDLRERTNLPMMECKKALEEAAGDAGKALEILRKRGIAKADTKLSQRSTADGRIGTYIHSTGKLAVLVELRCETDFVAKTEDFEALLKDLCLHVAGTGPEFVSREQVPAERVAKEKEILSEQYKGKPPQVVEKIVQGALDKFYERICLLDQPFVKDDSKKVKDLVTAAMAKMGEKVEVARFVRWEVGK